MSLSRLALELCPGGGIQQGERGYKTVMTQSIPAKYGSVERNAEIHRNIKEGIFKRREKKMRKEKWSLFEGNIFKYRWTGEQMIKMDVTYGSPLIGWA